MALLLVVAIATAIAPSFLSQAVGPLPLTLPLFILIPIPVLVPVGAVATAPEVVEAAVAQAIPSEAKFGARPRSFSPRVSRAVLPDVVGVGMAAMWQATGRRLATLRPRKVPPLIGKLPVHSPTRQMCLLLRKRQLLSHLTWLPPPTLIGVKHRRLTLNIVRLCGSVVAPTMARGIGKTLPWQALLGVCMAAVGTMCRQQLRGPISRTRLLGL